MPVLWVGTGGGLAEPSPPRQGESLGSGDSRGQGMRAYSFPCFRLPNWGRERKLFVYKEAAFISMKCFPHGPQVPTELTPSGHCAFYRQSEKILIFEGLIPCCPPAGRPHPCPGMRRVCGGSVPVSCHHPLRSAHEAPTSAALWMMGRALAGPGTSPGCSELETWDCMAACCERLTQPPPRAATGD